MSDLAFDVKEALVAAFEAAAELVPPAPLAGVSVYDSWPKKAIQGNRSVLVLDFEGDEEPATMRAGGGTYDDTFRIDIAVAVKRLVGDAKPIRDEARKLSAEVKTLVREQGAPGPAGAFGVAGVRMPRVRRYRVVEYVLDKGRECDIHLTLEFIGRVRAAR